MTRHGFLAPLPDERDCPVCHGTSEGDGGYCWPCAGTGDCDPEATPEDLAAARLDYERVAREAGS